MPVRACRFAMLRVMTFQSLAVAHLAATGFMAGLIWTIHVVHYPLFALVNEPYEPFQRAHMTRITRLLLLPWGVEVLTALALVVVAPDGVARALAGVGVALIAALVVVTGLGAAPAHGRLVERFDEAAHRRLLRVDRVRVVAWTLRLALAAGLVSLA